MVAHVEHGEYLIPVEANSSFILRRLTSPAKRKVGPWVPRSIQRYAEWHTFFDELVWLIKVTYSSPEELRRRQFKLDRLFSNFLLSFGPRLDRVSQAFATNAGASAHSVVSDLKRGWYNELAYAFPLRESTLGLTFGDVDLNKPSSEVRMVFPSWRFIQAYYAAYYYVRTLARQKFARFRLEQHGATLSTFKHSVVPVLGDTLWRWPFNVAYTPGRRVARGLLPIAALPHLRWQYARHPRPPNRSPRESFEFIYAELRRRGRSGSKPKAYNLVDYLYEFRVWANYQDMDSILNLWGPGYRAIIDMNLAVLLFFFGGVTEVAVVAHLGPRQLTQALQEFYDAFVSRQAPLAAVFPKSPLYQRYEILRILGLVDRRLRLVAEPRLHAVDAIWLEAQAAGRAT